MNGRDRGEGSLKSFYGYKETFGKGVVWVDVPRDLKFVHISNPYEDEGEEDAGAAPQVADDTTSGDERLAAGLAAFAEDAARYEENRHEHEYDLAQEAYPTYATHGLEALSAVASQDQHYYVPPPAPMSNSEQATSHYSPPEASPQQAQATKGLDYILNPASGMTVADSHIDPRLHSEISMHAGHMPSQQQQSPLHVRTHPYTPHFGRPRLHSKGLHHREPTIDDPELAFLVRDFSERAGLWMDLFDLGLFFSTTVPVLAVRCPLLLYSCVALSAKSLARVDGRKPVMGGQIAHARRSRMESWPGGPLMTEGWVHKARESFTTWQ